MSDLNVETLCPYNYVNYDNKKLSFKENMVLKYSTKITQDDLDKTLNSTEYKKILDKMNSDKVISSLIKIQNSSVKIKDDKIVFNYEVNPLPKYDIISYLPISIKPFNISFGAGLKAQDGKLQLCNLELNSIRYNYSYLMPIVNLLNPLSYRVSIDKNNKGENEIQNVKITDSKIEIDGIILIKKNME